MSSTKTEVPVLGPWDVFYSFVLSEANTLDTMLNNSGESGHPRLVPDLRGNTLSFSPLRMILVLGCSYIAL